MASAAVVVPWAVRVTRWEVVLVLVLVRVREVMIEWATRPESVQLVEFFSPNFLPFGFCLSLPLLPSIETLLLFID